MTRAAAVLLLVCAAVNLPSLFPGFIQDDHPIVEQNESLRDPSRYGEFLRRGYWSVAQNVGNNLYRPVTMLSFALNRTATGDGALGFRAVNLALHLLVTFLVYSVGRRVLEEAGTPATPAGGAQAAAHGIDPPLLAALLFAVHPVHTEVLGLVVGRAELLAAAGALLCVELFLRARLAGGGPPPGRPRLLMALALAAFVLGAFAKEGALVAPVLVLLADLLLVRRRPAWGLHAAAAATLLAALAIRSAVLGGFDPAGGTHFLDNPIATAPPAQGRLTAIAVITRCAEVLAIPWRLSIDYSYEALPLARGMLDPRVLAGGAVLAAGLWGVGRAWRRAPGVAFALAWAGVAFAPVANLLFPIGTIMAERLLYLPSVGLCWAGAAGFRALRRRFGEHRLAAGGGDTARAAAGEIAWLVAPAVLLTLLGARSEARFLDWRDDYTIFRAAARVVPRSAKAQFNYGAQCEERGENREAAGAYERAITIWAGFADAHYNLGGVRLKLGDPEAAVVHLREALRLEPFNVRHMVNLANALAARGEHTGARDLARRAAEIDPASDEAYTSLGSAELTLGDARAALEAYGEALRLEPATSIHLFNYALAQERTGDLRGAVATWRRGVAADPANPDMTRGLAMALLAAGELAEARRMAEDLARANPTNPLVRYLLGRVLEAAGEIEAAKDAYREAARLAPAAPMPQRALGLLLMRRGDRDGAREALERAARLDPRAWEEDAEGRRALETLRHPAAD